MDDAAIGFDAEQLVKLGRVTAAAASPCGTWAAVAVERLDATGVKYVSNLHRVPLEVDDVGGASALTVGEWRDRAPAFRKDGAVLFLSDRSIAGSDEERRTQVWLLPTQGEPRPLTDEPYGVSEFMIAQEGDVMVVLAEALPGVPHAEQRAVATRRKTETSLRHYQRMPVRFWDHWLPETEPHLVAFDAEGGSRRELTPNPGEALREASWDLSADGALVAAAWATDNPVDRISDRPLALIDTTTGLRRLLGAELGTVHVSPRFSPDGKLVAVMRYTRSRDHYAQKTLYRYSVGSGTARALTGGWDRWPEPWGFTPDGHQVVVTTDDQGQHGLFLVDVETGDVGRVSPVADGGSYSAIAIVPGQRLAVALYHSMLAPPEPHLIPLEAPGAPRALARLSGFHAGYAGAAVSRRSVMVEVGGGRSIHAFIVEPEEPPAERRAFLWIHGGPVSAWNDGWHWRWCPLLLAAAGYTVVLPNPAGSTGFGQARVNEIWGNTWGGRCFDDLMGVAQALEQKGILRASDTVVMGGSFGGYMTNWIGANTDRFRLLVAHAGMSGMASFHGTTDVPAWWTLMMGTTPWSDAAAFERYAPRRKVDTWRTPTLLLHGDKDYRVPVGEALQLFEALQAHGVLSELAIFPDEGHYVLKPRNIVAWYRTVLDFVDRHWLG